MQIGMWYWHTPFQVSKDELASLKKIGVTTLYVRAATFTTDGKRIKTMIPQQWKSDGAGFPVVLTFNFDAGLRSHFEQLPNTVIATDVVNGIAKVRKVAKSHAIHIVGIQMDVDCPTRLLPKYADLIRTIRPGLIQAGALPKGDSFSATALQTWLTSNDYDKLADACDFVAPQFYEGRIGRTLDKVQPIADTGNLKNGMKRAEASGKPFFVGLATYGHALLYDDRGGLIGMYHGMQPEDALRHPSLKMEREAPLTKGENLLVLKAIRPDMNGRGLGFRIAYVLPTAEMLSRQLSIVRTSRPSHCQGIILYRFPEAADELNLPLTTIAEGMANRPTTVAIKPLMTRRTVPWALIGAGKSAKTPPYEYTVTVKSTGTAPTIAAHNALSLLITFDGNGLGDVAPGDFDDVKTGVYHPGLPFQPCASAHANAILLHRFHVLPGAQIRSGGIEVDADGPRPTQIFWNARTGSGGTTSVEGKLSPLEFPK